MQKRPRAPQVRRLRWHQVSIDIIGLSCGRRQSNETCLIWVPSLSSHKSMGPPSPFGYLCYMYHMYLFFYLLPLLDRT
jgi:hypothetical protein